MTRITTLNSFLLFVGMMTVVMPSPAQTTPQRPPTSVDISNCSQPLPDAVTDVKIPDANNFYAAASNDGCWIFVTARGPKGDRLLVFSKSGGAIKLQREITVSDPSDMLGWFRLTHDQKLLIIASTKKFLFLDVAKIISGDSNPVIGKISDQHFSGLGGSALSADDKYLIVSQMNTSWLTIVDLQKARSNGFNTSAIVAGAPTPVTNAVGLAFSSDEKFIYLSGVQEEEDLPTPLTCRNLQRPMDPPDHGVGFLAVMGLKSGKAPELSRLATVSASCGWSWLTISPDGNTLFASSREENKVFAYDTRPVQDGKPPVLIGTVPVGSIPTHSELIGDGHLLAVSNSNQFNTTPTTKDTVTIIDTKKIDKGADAVLGTITVGADPRNIWSSDDGKLLIVDSIRSGTMQVIDTQRLDSKLNKK